MNFIALIKYIDGLDIIRFKAKDEDEAYKILEDEIVSSNFSSEFVITEKEFNKAIKRFKK